MSNELRQRLVSRVFDHVDGIKVGPGVLVNPDGVEADREIARLSSDNRRLRASIIRLREEIDFVMGPPGPGGE